MIYNLVQYIEDELGVNDPTLSTNGFQPNDPDDCIAVIEGSGDEQDWFDRLDSQLQFIARSKSRPKAREIAYKVYDLLKKKYGVVLPLVVVSGITYPSVKTWGIRPINTPQYVADDSSGRSMFSFNLDITTT